MFGVSRYRGVSTDITYSVACAWPPSDNDTYELRRSFKYAARASADPMQATATTPVLFLNLPCDPRVLGYARLPGATVAQRRASSMAAMSRWTIIYLRQKGAYEAAVRGLARFAVGLDHHEERSHLSLELSQGFLHHRLYGRWTLAPGRTKEKASCSVGRLQRTPSAPSVRVDIGYRGAFLRSLLFRSQPSRCCLTR